MLKTKEQIFVKKTVVYAKSTVCCKKYYFLKLIIQATTACILNSLICAKAEISDLIIHIFCCY